MNREDMMTLEGLVDRYSLLDVIEALAEMTSEKADHLRTNWQDERGARAWERDSRILQSASGRIGK